MSEGRNATWPPRAQQPRPAPGRGCRAARQLGGVGPRGRVGDGALYLRAVVASKRDGDPAAAELLERAAAELAQDDPERAALAEVQAAEVWMEWVDYERALAAAERASALPFERGGKTELAVLLAQGDTAGWAGRFEEAVAYWRRAAELVDADDPDQLRIAGEALFPPATTTARYDCCAEPSRSPARGLRSAR